MNRLPYWPSEAFVQEAMKMSKEKGWKGTDEQLIDQILLAYRAKRKELVARKLGKQVHKRGHKL